MAPEHVARTSRNSAAHTGGPTTVRQSSGMDTSAAPVHTPARKRSWAQRTGSRALSVTSFAILALMLLTTFFLIWANSPMQGERRAALDVWENPAISVEQTPESVILSPANGASDTGLVFIPGARVDPYAYMYKLSGIVEAANVTVVITKPTLNLAFFDTRSLDTFTAPVAGIDRWYVGGHSLGGVRACQLAEAGAADGTVEGLILFGSFCANDVAGSGIAVLSISGSEDGLSTPQKITDARPLLPSDAVMVEIEGANHASFGNYGVQSGDGKATLGSAEARNAITESLVEFFGR